MYTGTGRYHTTAAREKQRQYNRKHYLKKKRMAGALDEKKVLLSARVPEYIVARLQRLMALGLVTGKYPCKSMGEAVVWMLKEGLKSLRDDPEMGDSVKYVEAREAIEGVATVRREGLRLLHRASEEVAAMLSIGAEIEAQTYFNQALTALYELTPTVWSIEAEKQFKAKFPDLAKDTTVKDERILFPGGKKRKPKRA